MKAEFGGGTRGFSCEEDFIYENVESELRFFTSQVRRLSPACTALVAGGPRGPHALSPAGATEHHPFLAPEPPSQAGGGSAQRAFPGGPADQ